MQRRAFLKCGAAGTTGLTMGLAGCLGDIGGGDDFPSESLTWMIPWSEGGGTDTYARQLSPHMEEPLGESIEIDNREGAGSMVGSEWLHAQDNDGHTFGTVNSPGWDFTWRAQEIDDWHPDDFEPISYAGFFGYTLIVNNRYEIETFDGLRDAYADGDITGFAHQGAGSDSHLTTLLLREEYGLEYDTAVPYDGGGPAMEAVISDEVAAGFATNTSAVNAEESGEASAIVNLMDVDLTDVWPDIDRIDNYGDSLAWITEFGQMQVAPEGTPEDVRQQISEAVEEAINHDDPQAWSEDTGNILEYGDMDAAADRLDGTVDKIEQRVDEAIGGFDEFLRMAEEEE
ncbi:Bug family tripartite tricarboxylate transporter substrate binding protein [Natronosalvus vescus]|uniref:Bug family tripartite tricarboxylate transporter substrate binding protein n=1 Tax=Natronosalvus vescus TaxID=2953881 RepID=UPI002090A016|nr:tripartite tricarboxylate transporter substrate-binding protein [Natronosalvus vescus]